jgi:hypothetical protein
MILISKYPTDTESEFQEQNRNTQIYFLIIQPRSNIQMFYLCVGTEIYTCSEKSD